MWPTVDECVVESMRMQRVLVFDGGGSASGIHHRRLRRSDHLCNLLGRIAGWRDRNRHREIRERHAPHLVLTAIRVPNYGAPSWPDEGIPSQIHLDFAAPDLDGAQERADGIGARLADHQPAPSKCRVPFDPAGHPFCLSLA
ncbi:VOC family protein, partial [Streptomyces sp. NPDC101166]|uniref:VOC family protein n=1 Tax=Streptomyces sp. NPDC101166 TaxID=3366120 RepID=UPI0038118F7F